MSKLDERISEKYRSLSKGQKKLASYVSEHYEEAVFMTALELGEACGVSESTAVRFAMELGYSGYPEFKKALEESVKDKLSGMEQMEAYFGRIEEGDILPAVLASDREKLSRTLAEIDTDVFAQAVETFLEARNIYICGIRSCAPLAEFAAFYMNLIFPGVKLLRTNSAAEIFEQLLRVGEGDVFFGISFPRYSMRTLKAMEIASNKGAKIVTLTDSNRSPLTLYSSVNLYAKSDMASIMDSLVAPLSVINALIVALCLKRQDSVMQNMTELDKIWSEYENDELDRFNDAADVYSQSADDSREGENA